MEGPPWSFRLSPPRISDTQGFIAGLCPTTHSQSLAGARCASAVSDNQWPLLLLGCYFLLHEKLFILVKTCLNAKCACLTRSQVTEPRCTLILPVSGRHGWAEFSAGSWE